MERFYRQTEIVDAKDVDLRRKGELYRVEDVMLSGGVLTTKSGAVLTPTPSPAPENLPSATPEVEPSAIPSATPKIFRRGY